MSNNDFVLALKNITSQPQRQDSTHAQLMDVLPFARQLGLYGAENIARECCRKTNKKLSEEALNAPSVLPMNLKQVLQGMPLLSESIEDLSTQQSILCTVANRLGLYEASDYLKDFRQKHPDLFLSNDASPSL